MTRPLSILFTAFILTAATSHAQQLEPLELAKKIFSVDTSFNVSQYATGEYKGHPDGFDLRGGTVSNFIVLEQTANKAVVAMTVLDSSGKKGIDTYLYFEKDTVWKMNAFRALAMTGLIERAKNELEKMTIDQVDKMIAASKDSSKKALFTSRDDYYFELGNTRLILELDENIIKHFLDHKAEFERIKNAAIKEHPDKLTANMRKKYKKLFITSVSYGGYDTGSKCLNFLIGGMVDNMVGYLYVRDKKDLPEMDDAKVIMLREIGDGWYLYKTT